MSEIDSGRAAFQVLVFPFQREEEGFVYALFRPQDAGYWQGVAGGGEVGESPLEAARREACEEAGIGGWRTVRGVGRPGDDAGGRGDG